MHSIQFLKNEYYRLCKEKYSLKHLSIHIQANFPPLEHLKNNRNSFNLESNLKTIKKIQL